MDEDTKKILAGWVRHVISGGAGAVGLATWLNPDLEKGLVTLVLALLALGWSSVEKMLRS